MAKKEKSEETSRQLIGYRILGSDEVYLEEEAKWRVLRCALGSQAAQLIQDRWDLELMWTTALRFLPAKLGWELFKIKPIYRVKAPHN